jgi:hypothetical protein
MMSILGHPSCKSICSCKELRVYCQPSWQMCTICISCQYTLGNLSVLIIHSDLFKIRQKVVNALWPPVTNLLEVWQQSSTHLQEICPKQRGNLFATPRKRLKFSIKNRRATDKFKSYYRGLSLIMLYPSYNLQPFSVSWNCLFKDPPPSSCKNYFFLMFILSTGLTSSILFTSCGIGFPFAPVNLFLLKNFCRSFVVARFEIFHIPLLGSCWDPVRLTVNDFVYSFFLICKFSFKYSICLCPRWARTSTGRGSR